MSKSAYIWLGLGLTLASAGAAAQTNTFPPSGNVGIGTTSPNPNFDLTTAGNGIFTTNAPNNSGVYITGQSGIFGELQAVNAANSIPISLVLQQWGGNVGIGTTNPISALQIGNNVNSTSHTSLLIPSWDSTAGYAQIVGGWNAAGYWGIGPLNGSTTPTLQIGNVLGSQAEYDGPWAPTQNLNLVVGGSVGIGTTAPAYSLDVAGVARAQQGVIYPDGNKQMTAWTGVLCGGDYAEAVDVKGSKKSYEPGDVLVIGDGSDGEVLKSAEPYSTMVAGIFATRPGVIGRRVSLVKDREEVPMAMVGIVPTKVTAENGPIHRGDLLVTSSTSGFAMKGTDRSRLVGAVIGKAMGSLETGTGVIEVLVTLQ